MKNKIFKSLRLVMVLFVFSSVFVSQSFFGTPVKAASFCFGSLEQDGDDNFLLSNAEDLELLSCMVRHVDGAAMASYVLTQDIDMSEVSDWIPIGTSTSAFEGTFDGRGYTISNLTIDKFVTYHIAHSNFEMYAAGLFGNVQRAFNLVSYPSIKNVTLNNMNISVEGSEQVLSPNADGIPVFSDDRMFLVGVLASSMTQTNVEDVSILNSSITLRNIDDNLNLTVTKVGGLSGYTDYVTIDDVESDVDLNVFDDEPNPDNASFPFFLFVGGVTGNSHKTSINDSRYDGDISVTSNTFLTLIGGLSGANDTSSPNDFGFSVSNTHRNNVVNASITSLQRSENTMVGGLFGVGDSINVERSSFEGTIQAESNYEVYMGGLMGQLFDQSIISESFSRGSLNSDSLQYSVGGLIGIHYGDDVEKLFVNDAYSRMAIEIGESASTGGKRINATGGLIGRSNDFEYNVSNAYFAGSIIDNNEVVDIDNIINPHYYEDKTMDDSYYGLYYDEEITESTSLFGVGKTTLEMKERSTFEAYDFDTVWVRSDDTNDGYPDLRFDRFFIEFEPNNNSDPFTQVGFKATEPSDPTKHGFSFVGWRLSDETSNFDFSTDLENDIVLTAYYLSIPTTEVVENLTLLPKASNLESAYTFTEEERQQEVSIKLQVEALPRLSDAEKELMDAYLKTLDKSYESVFYVDISLFKVVGESESNITEANEEVMISFVLPEEFRDQEFVMINLHEGQPIVIETTYNEETFEITFSSKYFSSFVLAQEVVEEEPDKDTEIVDTSDSNNYLAWVLFMMGLMLLGFEKLSKKESV